MQSLMYAVNRQCLTPFNTFYSIAAHLPLLITEREREREREGGREGGKEEQTQDDGRVEEQTSVYHSIRQMVFAQLKST